MPYEGLEAVNFKLTSKDMEIIVGKENVNEEWGVALISVLLSLSKAKTLKSMAILYLKQSKVMFRDPVIHAECLFFTF